MLEEKAVLVEEEEDWLVEKKSREVGTGPVAGMAGERNNA